MLYMHMDYCDTVWDILSTTQQDKLEKNATIMAPGKPISIFSGFLVRIWFRIRLRVTNIPLVVPLLLAEQMNSQINK